jgi:hypothetical protein
MRNKSTAVPTVQELDIQWPEAAHFLRLIGPDEERPRRRVRSKRDDEEERPRRRSRSDEDENAYERAQTPYDMAVIDARRLRQGKRGRPLTTEEDNLRKRLRVLDEARAAVDEAAYEIRRYVNQYATLRATYDRFLKAGGVSADDFEAMIRENADSKSKPVKCRGVLRLVHSRRGVPRKKLSSEVKR